jgi:beta-glucanase (GH16 family)
LVWSDEFNGPSGAFNSIAKWSLATGGGGWGNHESQCYTTSRKNSATNGSGQLVITALRSLGQRCADGHYNAFTSARLTTQSKFTVTHGRLEIRAKLPAGAGAWPAFWALGANGPQVGWPRCGEIDVMEYTGNRPTVTTSAAHAATYFGAHWYATRTSPTSSSLSSQFHVYAVDWTSSTLTYYRDSTVIGRITRAEVIKHGVWPFDKPFYLLINLAMGGTYAGSVPASVQAPQRYVLDYVRIYH